MDFTKMTSNQLLAFFYIWANVISIIIFGILLFKIRKNKHTTSIYFYYIILFLIIYFIGDSVWALAFFDLIPHSDVIIKYARMTYYIASGFVSYCWLMYVEITIDSKLVFSKKRKLLYIPIAISTISTILICIFLNPARKDIYGYLTALALIIIPFVYIITAGIITLIKAHRTKDLSTKKKLTIFAIWPLVILIISVLQVYFAEIPIFCFGAIIVIVYLYIYNQDSFIFTDALTGINNRTMINKYVEDLSSRDGIYYILMIDIDKFKSINDTYGHIEGDRALKYMANTLKKISSNKNLFLARYGGDEFMIIIKSDDLELVNNIINSINEELKKSFDVLGYSFSASIGYSILNQGDSIEDTIKKADVMLYENKEIAHKQK